MNSLLAGCSTENKLPARTRLASRKRLGRRGICFALTVRLPTATTALVWRPPFSSGYQRRWKNINKAKESHATVDLVALFSFLDSDDATTATHLAGTPSVPPLTSSTPLQPKALATLQHMLQQANYTTEQVGHLLNMDPRRVAQTACPLFLTPAEPGTLTIPQVDDLLQKHENRNLPVAALTALFLLGATLSYQQAHQCLGVDFVNLAESLSFLSPSALDPSRCLATVQIFPLTSVGTLEPRQMDRTTLYFITDWHPRVLCQTHVDEEPAVMYVGPDSLGLVQQFGQYVAAQEDSSSSKSPTRKITRILDVCTGCGIQGLSLLLELQQKAQAEHDTVQLTCLDVSPRALRFVVANALLNGIKDLSKMRLVQADLCSHQGQPWNIQLDSSGEDTTSVRLVVEDSAPLEDLLDPSAYDVVMANPPFLPVPPSLIFRHGAFSNGGTSGEEVLQAIVELASRVLQPKGGTLAVVSEFFLADNPQPAADLLNRIHHWWRTGQTATTSQGTELSGFLVTNELPISREVYATRRANNNQQEYDIWMQHLTDIGMNSASPGFLFLQKRKPSIGLDHVLAPKSPQGSLWTPSNPEAVTFTAHLLNRMYKG